MLSILSPATQTLLASGAAALCYVIAMIGMKLWTEGPSLAIGLVIAVTMGLATVLEVFALRGERLGIVYVTIIGLEVIVMAAAVLFFLDESFSAREVLGCALVLVGVALAWS